MRLGKSSPAPFSVINGGKPEEPPKDGLNVKLRAEQAMSGRRKLTSAEIQSLRHDHDGVPR